MPGYEFGWILDEGTFDSMIGLRPLDSQEAVRHEWGEAAWTARILAEGEVASLELARLPHRGCF